MQFLSVLSAIAAFSFVFTAASPVLETESTLAKRQEADVLAILTTLHTQALASVAAISAFFLDKPCMLED